MQSIGVQVCFAAIARQSVAVAETCRALQAAYAPGARARGVRAARARDVERATVVRIVAYIDLATIGEIAVAIETICIARDAAETIRAGRRAVDPGRARRRALTAMSQIAREVHLAAVFGESVAIPRAGGAGGGPGIGIWIGHRRVSFGGSRGRGVTPAWNGRVPPIERRLGSDLELQTACRQPRDAHRDEPPQLPHRFSIREAAW